MQSIETSIKFKSCIVSMLRYNSKMQPTRDDNQQLYRYRDLDASTLSNINTPTSQLKQPVPPKLALVLGLDSTKLYSKLEVAVIFTKWLQSNNCINKHGKVIPNQTILDLFEEDEYNCGISLTNLQSYLAKLY